MGILLHRKLVTLQEAQALPFWRRPAALLVMMSAAMPLAFSTWMALLNNFVIEIAQFDGVDIGWLQTVREIPGFLAVGVIRVHPHPGALRCALPGDDGTEPGGGVLREELTRPGTLDIVPCHRARPIFVPRQSAPKGVSGCDGNTAA